MHIYSKVSTIAAWLGDNLVHIDIVNVPDPVSTKMGDRLRSSSHPRHLTFLIYM